VNSKRARVLRGGKTSHKPNKTSPITDAMRNSDDPSSDGIQVRPILEITNEHGATPTITKKTPIALT
jgi:hypothetical protein